MYISKHFGLEELVWKELFKELHDKNMLWVLYRKFDDRFLMTIDQFREDFGSTLINNWSFKDGLWLNGIYEYSCARPAIIPKGEKWSFYTTHVDFNTGDLKVKKYKDLVYADKLIAYNEARQYIIDHPEKYPYVTVLESGDYAPTWVHLATSNFRHQSGNIRIIKP